MIPSNLLSFPFSVHPSSSVPSLLNGIPNPNPNFSPSPPPIRARRFRCPSRRTGRSWDSNAESVRTGRFRFRDDDKGEADGGFWKRDKRRWWADDSSDQFDEEFEPDDVVEQPWDRFWIFQVFKSYGYLLPAIIASMLLATGPKAFLMALALPLGQSALSLAIDKLWGKEPSRTKPKTKKKPFARSTRDFKRQGGEESRTDDQGRQGYQSWVSADVGVADKGSGRRGPTFGGWDELDGINGSRRRQSPTVDGSPQAQSVKKGKLTKRKRMKDVPLFLRLLIAVFPFLGSWTKLL